MMLETHDLPPLSLAATLFTAAGKRSACVRSVAAHGARVETDGGWPEGSIAILVRHGVRVFATIARGPDGLADLTFEEPLTGTRLDQFRHARRVLRTVVAAERRAA